MIEAVKQMISNACWHVKSFYVNTNLTQLKEEIKHVAEPIASHPKTAVAVTGLANINVWWLDYGEPLIKALTSIAGLIVVILLVIKHCLDLKDRISKKDEEQE